MKVILGILGAIIIGVSIVYFVPSLHEKAADLLSYSQCDAPIPYKIGSIDARFNLSPEKALQNTTEAANLWSGEKGKVLFTYSPKAELTINFVYDQRQALDNQISELNSELKANSKTLQQQKADYEADVRSFEQRLKIFQETVDSYNKQGGAPENVYNELINQQKVLEDEGKVLNQRARELNLSTKNYNSSISSLNQNIDAFNSLLVEKPEEGVYESYTNTITLYFASNHAELIHTLAHEFGHAMGMGHVDDPKAIMYPNTTEFLVATEADLQQLAYVCREQSAILHWFRVFDIWLIKNTQNLQLQRG